jgi:hypothetical protein
MARVCLDLLAQLADVDTDGAAIAEVAPDQLEDVVAAEHLTWVLDVTVWGVGYRFDPPQAA